jgi:hypothetical protein
VKTKVLGGKPVPLPLCFTTNNINSSTWCKCSQPARSKNPLWTTSVYTHPSHNSFPILVSFITYNRIFLSNVPVIIREPVEGKLPKSALTFVSGFQTIPAPSGASNINVPTHVPLLCTVSIYIHLLHMCAPTSVCGIHGHPYIFFHFSPTYSAQSLPVLIAVLLF